MYVFVSACDWSSVLFQNDRMLVYLMLFIGIGLTVTLDSNFPDDGVMFCVAPVGVAVLVSDGVGVMVTLESSFPAVGLTTTFDVLAACVFCSLGVGFTVTCESK